MQGDTCGVVAAAIMVIGAVCGADDPSDVHRRGRMMGMVAEFSERFIGRHGSSLCRELSEAVSLPTSERARMLRESGEPQRLIGSGAALLAKVLSENGVADDPSCCIS